MRGFSLVEALVALGIMAVILMVGATSYRAVLSSTNAREASYLYLDALREAQTKARLMEYDTNVGTSVVAGYVVVFSGTSYAARTTSRDRRYKLPSGVTVAGPTEVVFTKFTAAPSTTGTTTFANAYATSSVNIATGSFTHTP